MITYLVKLDHIWVSHNLQDVYFPCHSLDVRLVFDLVLLQDFNGNFLSSYQMSAQTNFAKCSLSKWSPYRKW